MIVRNMRHPKREINQPFILEVASKFYTLFPTIGDYLASGILTKVGEGIEKQSNVILGFV